MVTGDASTSEFGGDLTDGSVKADLGVISDNEVLAILGRNPSFKERIRLWIVESQLGNGIASAGGVDSVCQEVQLSTHSGSAMSTVDTQVGSSSHTSV